MAKRILREWSFLVLFLILVLATNPFGLAEESQRYSSDLFYQVVAPQYPGDMEPGAAREAFNDTTQIAVVLFNDDALRELRNREDGVTFGSDIGTTRAYTWPVKYAVHRDVIAKIIEAKPTALFIDFGFFDNRGDAEGLQYFADFLKEHALPPSKFTNCALLYRERRLDEGYKDRGHDCSNKLSGTGEVPIFLATLDADRPVDVKVLEILAGSVTGLVTTRRHENRYELYDCRSGLPSPALAMYAVGSPLSQGLRPDCGGAGDAPGGAGSGTVSGLNAMAVYWPAWGSDGESRGIFGCHALPETWQGRLLQLLFGSWVSGEGLSASLLRQACPPHRTASPAHLFDPGKDWMTYFMEDRYVVYGGDFVGASDTFRPPTHEAVPGSYLHAMALDNLLRYRNDHWKLPKQEQAAWLQGITLSDLVTLGFVLIVSTISAVATCCLPRLDSDHLEDWFVWKPALGRVPGSGLQGIPGNLRIVLLVIAAYFLAWILSCIFTVSVSALLFFQLKIPPINFIGLLSFTGVHHAARSLRAIVCAIL